ncbi:MAG TPA: protein phosphatase 2C domain-containing protein [Ktedonobacterales bacterium]
MPEESADQGAPITEEAGTTALPPGARIADYVIVGLLESDSAGNTYLATLASDEADEGEGRTPGPLEPMFRLIERPVGGHDGLRPLLALHLHHPRLLAPRGVITQGDRDYLVIDAVREPDPGDTDERPPLDPAGAMTAGVGLADALTYLHRSGVAHLHVSPTTVFVRDGRAQLGDIEDAQMIHPLDPQAARLFARDANFLARTLGVLAGVVEDAPERAGAAATALAAIVARGAAGEFSSPEEVGNACSAGLPRNELTLPEVEAPPENEQVAYAVATATSVGRVRSENQDASATALFSIRDDANAREGATAPAAVFLVADGMGGEARGELASRIAARVVMSEFVRELVVPVMLLPVEAAQIGLASTDVALPSLGDALARAARSANARIRKLSDVLGKATGTTLTAVAVIGTRAALVHVGDSRAYLLRSGQLTQLSEDHTLLARMQAMDHPLLHDPAFTVPRSYLYRSLGQEDEPEIDMVEFSFAPGDRLLLCSDGLWDEVPPEGLLELLAGGDSPQECAQALITAADAMGGHDNSTAVVVFAGGARRLAIDEEPTTKQRAL